MKIRKVKWLDHPILGNLELEFLKDDGSIYDNIILVGENGSGKTSILSTISTFLNIGSFDCFEFLEFEANGIVYKAHHRDANQSKPTFFRLENTADGTQKRINSDKVNSPVSIQDDVSDPRSYGSIFAKARADYKTDKITHTSSMELDKDVHPKDIEDNFTTLKQLMVDISEQDDHEYRTMNRGKAQKDVVTDEEFNRDHSKLQRFVKAFNTFFSDTQLHFHDIQDLADQKEILFEKHHKQIPIDNLSTGEKQIVFRGVYLLRNLKKLSGGTVFIDEPEISMHPRWQKKILNYYQRLFKDAARKQTCQMFFATHSNFILESALENASENLIIVLTDNNGTIESRKVELTDRRLPSITTAEINYIAFNLITRDYHNELYGYLQRKEGIPTVGDAYNVKECDDYILRNGLYDSTRYHKTYSYTMRGGRVVTYQTLPTYVRNCIDHPDPVNHPEPREDELRTSIELLRELCR